MKRLEQLTFRYSENDNVFESLTFDVPSGEISYIVGASGAGKTTLSLLLADELKPTTGTIVPPDPTALVMQFPELLFLKQTLLEEANSFGAKLDYDRVSSYLERFGIDIKLHGATSPERFSFAQRRLIAIALQAARNENTLVLDEPTLGLDEDNLRKVADFVREESAKRSEVVVITHDLELIEHAPGIVFLLAGGRCAWQGLSSEYLKRRELLDIANAI